MATLTANLTANSGRIQSSNASYATAQAGSSLSLASGYSLFAGQVPTTNVIYESFAEFDTSVIPSTATIQSVTLQFNPNTDFSTTDFVFNVYASNWSTLSTANWQPPAATFGSTTVLATLSTNGWTTGAYNAFTLNGSNLANAIVKAGKTQLILVSSRAVANITPSANEYAGNNANVSSCLQLIVTYATIGTRTLTSTTGLKAQNARTLIATTGFKARLARTLTSTSALKGSAARTLTSTSSLTLRLVRTLVSTSALKGRPSRTVVSMSLLQGSAHRTLASTTLLAYHEITPLLAPSGSGVTRAIPLGSTHARISGDGATAASDDGAVHAVLTGNGATKARFS